MKNLPGGADLLAIAQETLTTEGENANYVRAMIANANAIAARETEMGERPEREALDRLDSLHGVAKRELHEEALAGALLAHERRLAADIRAGRYDGNDDRRRRLIEHLRLTVKSMLEISNPKSLEP